MAFEQLETRINPQFKVLKSQRMHSVIFIHTVIRRLRSLFAGFKILMFFFLGFQKNEYCLG